MDWVVVAVLDYKNVLNTVDFSTAKKHGTENLYLIGR